LDASLLRKVRLIERSARHYGVGPGEIYLRGGDPNFATPAYIRDAAIKAILEGYTHYPPRGGIPECREAITRYYSKYGVDYDPSQVFITSGGGAALYLSMAGILEPGDEVLVFDPSYAANFSYPAALGAKVVPVPLTESGFHFDPEELKKRVTDRSKMFILNNPNNPTGTIHTIEELRALADIAVENDLTVISDEFYIEYVYDGKEHTAVSSLDGMKERTIVVIGGTKCFAFTGWRLASMIIPQQHYRKVTDPIIFRIGPATFVQRAGAVGFTGLTQPHGMEVMKEWRDEFDRRRKFFCKRMDEIEGIKCHTFEGAFYAYPDISSLKESRAHGHIRPALVQDLETLEEAANRIERFIKSL
jgi:aspartate/methionine/tyrosine aminotransferase